MNVNTTAAPLRQKRFARKTPARRWLVFGIWIVAIAVVLVAGDRVAAAVAEDNMAGQIQSQGFPVKPKVTIHGFPFLTQLISRDLRDVDITANGVKEGPVIVDIAATMTDVHINASLNGATVGHISGVATVPFSGLADATGAPNLTVSDAGNDLVKLTFDLGFTSASATARITRVGKNQISVKLLSTDGVPADLLSSVGDFTLPLPALPFGISIQSISVSAQGIQVHITGQNVTFTQ